MPLIFPIPGVPGAQMFFDPYGNGGAVESILDVLEKFPLNNILQKKFSI